MQNAVEHFAVNYGETMKAAVEYAPRYDYNILEGENKEMKKVWEPLKKEVKREKKNQRFVQLKFDKLMANVNYTRALRKRYESRLEELRD